MWDALLNLSFDIVHGLADFVGDWGLAIIIVTVIIRLCLLPLTHKQNKSSYMMAKVQPQIKEIQEKYAGDQQKINEEMQALYREVHFNPLSGCLPMLIQMPIFILLFQVLRSIGERVEPGTVVSFYGIVPDLTITATEAYQTLGLASSIIYFAMVIFFAASTLIPQLINKQQMTGQTKGMMIFMVVFMGYIGFISPAGVVLYWDVSSLIGIGTQLLTKKMLANKEEKEAVEKVPFQPTKVEVERRQKKARPRKSR